MGKLLIDRKDIEAVFNTLSNGGGSANVLRWAETILAQQADSQTAQNPFAYADPSDLNRMEKHGQACMTVWKEKQNCVSEPLFLCAVPTLQTELKEALRSFVVLSEQRLQELGGLSPEMTECLRKGRAALGGNDGKDGKAKHDC